jgi:hypothetical protein
MTPELTPEEQQGQTELIVLAIILGIAMLLIYRNRDMIKKWFDDAVKCIR